MNTDNKAINTQPSSKEDNGFTPREWSISNNTVTEQIQIAGNNKAICFINYEKYRGFNDWEEAEANARLIADAPRLYRENKELKDYIEYVDGKVEMNEFPLSFDQWQEFNEMSKEETE